MKAALRWVLAGSLASLALGAQAQSQAAPDATAQQLAEAIGPDRLPSPTTRNAAMLMQNGANNTATLNQTSFDLPANQAYIVQVGANNLLSLDQTGSANRATYTQTGTANQSALSQRGNANALEGTLTGDQNAVNVRQQGNNNQVLSEVAANGRQYDLSQTGNNNTLTQRETTPSAVRGYSVDMRGSNMHITVEQGHVAP